MVFIRTPNSEPKRIALGHLAGHFEFESWASGEMLVPEDALSYLAIQGVVFTVEGPATDAHIGSEFQGCAATTI